jgi:hypothetical protein
MKTAYALLHVVLEHVGTKQAYYLDLMSQIKIYKVFSYVHIGENRVGLRFSPPTSHKPTLVLERQTLGPAVDTVTHKEMLNAFHLSLEKE